MDAMKRPADIPANYVTLLELQEQWRRKQIQKDQQPEEEDNKQKQVQQLSQRKPQAQRFKGGRRISNGDLKKSDCLDCPVKNDVEGGDCPLENDAFPLSPMDAMKRPADIPANYVTLLELQERWKRKQMQKDQQPEEEDYKQKQVQQLSQRKPQAQRLKRGRRISNGDLKKSDCVDCPVKNDVEGDCPVENDADVVVVSVQGNESENFLTETKREGLGKRRKKKKKKKGRKKKEEEKQKEEEDEEKKKEREMEEEKTMEYGEAREKRKEERIADNAQTPPVKSESNVPARRPNRMMDKRMEYRQKTISALKKGDRTVKIEGKVENVAEGTDATLKIKRKYENTLEKSEEPVEIEEKLRNLSVGKENELLETQNSIVISSNSYKILNGRNSNRIVNRSNSQSGYYNRNFYGRNVEIRVHNNRGNYGRFSRQYRGSYKGVSNGRRDMIWVKKEEIVDNGEGAGDQSSGNSAGAI